MALYTVEWSTEPAFSEVINYEIISDIVRPERLVMEDLQSQVPYYFRLSVANLAGFGLTVMADPAPCTITCRWY